MATKRISGAVSTVEKKIANIKQSYLSFVSEKFDSISIHIEGDTLTENIADLFVIDDTPMGVRSAMAKVSAQFAYYSNIKDICETTLSELRTQQEGWFTERYLDVSKEFEKGTETFKKAQVQTRWRVDFEKWENSVRKVQSAVAGAKTILHALEIKQQMLSGINAMIRSEQEAFKVARL